MRISLAVAIAMAAVTTMASTSSAQIFEHGYQFGAGFNQLGVNQCFGRFGLSSREEPPYFAKFPPVYYSGIVPRPYGISPYAVPAGIAPVEMSVPVPVTINNPFFQNEAIPVSNDPKPEPAALDSDGNKVTWRPNPYVESLATRE